MDIFDKGIVMSFSMIMQKGEIPSAVILLTFITLALQECSLGKWTEGDSCEYLDKIGWSMWWQEVKTRLMPQMFSHAEGETMQAEPEKMGWRMTRSPSFLTNHTEDIFMCQFWEIIWVQFEFHHLISFNFYKNPWNKVKRF